MNPPSSSEPRLTLRDRFRAATREAILEAAAGLLTADGAAHVRMEDIAAAAGIAVGTLYNYFEDRAALVRALLDTPTRTLFAVLDAPPARSGRTEGDAPAVFARELSAFVTTVVHHFNTNRVLLRLLREEEGRRGVDVRGVTRRRGVLDELFLRAERLAARGIRTHVLRKADPATYAAILVGMIRGVVWSALDRGAALPADAGAAIVRVFLTGAAR